jgi:uncharacterized damage-inducible protein DinB
LLLPEAKDETDDQSAKAETCGPRIQGRREMIESAELLVDAFDRVRGVVHTVVDGLTPNQLEFRIDDTANSIAWLVWHLTRIQDDHVADVAGEQQVWTSQGWAQRLRLPFDESATGYGHGPDEVAAVRVDSGGLLAAYHDAVNEQTRRYLERLTVTELGRTVDDSWEPPVSLRVRLVSVVTDDLQHAGQAAFVRGIAERRQWRQ